MVPSITNKDSLVFQRPVVSRVLVVGQVDAQCNELNSISIISDEATNKSERKNDIPSKVFKMFFKITQNFVTKQTFFIGSKVLKF